MSTVGEQGVEAFSKFIEFLLEAFDHTERFVDVGGEFFLQPHRVPLHRVSAQHVEVPFVMLNFDPILKFLHRRATISSFDIVLFYRILGLRGSVISR